MIFMILETLNVNMLDNLGNQQDKIMWEEMYPKTVPVEDTSPNKDK